MVDLEDELAADMAAYEKGGPAFLPVVPWRASRPQGAYPSDFGRKPIVQDCGPEWDFRPAEER